MMGVSENLRPLETSCIAVGVQFANLLWKRFGYYLLKLNIHQPHEPVILP